MKRAFIPLLMTGLCALPLHAQQGLVLSGGGSKGLAHAGVLAVLEERGYDSDIVVGTSMGAVIGALYAGGYTPAEIGAQIKAVEWRSIFEPSPVIAGPDHVIRYPMVAIDLGVARFRFSRGLVGQWRINRALAHLLFDGNARSRGNFDSLPRRYRAIVADLKTGKPIALDGGDLALAVRASMSVPGFFAPVEWTDMVLIDGGIAANLPTGFARDLGAQHVVAVNVAQVPEEVHSHAPLQVIERAIDHMIANAQKGTPQPDVLVLPDIAPDFSAANFPDDPSELIELGRVAAVRDLPDNAAPRTGPRAERPLPTWFTALRVEAPDSAMAALVRKRFGAIAPGSYDRAAVIGAVDALYATGLFEGVWPRVTTNDTLVVRVVGQPKLAFTAAANYENDRGGRAWGSLDRSATLLDRPSVMSASAVLSALEKTLTLASRIHTINTTGLAASVGGHASDRSVRSYADDIVTVQDVTRAGGWLAFDTPHILRDHFTVIGVRAEWIDIESGDRGIAAGPFVRWASIEAPAAPVGIPFLVEGEKRWGGLPYWRASFSGSRSLFLNTTHLALVGDARLVSNNAPIDVMPSLGGGHTMPGMRWSEQRGLARIVVGADAAYPLGVGFVRLRVRGGAVADDLESTFESDRWVAGAQAGIFFPTPLGSLDVNYGYATNGNGRFDISIGQRFQ